MLCHQSKGLTRLPVTISKGKLFWCLFFVILCSCFFYFVIAPISAYEYTIPARGKELVKTDLQIELPHGCYGRIAPRSGLAWKNFIDVGGKNFIFRLPLRTTVSPKLLIALSLTLAVMLIR